MGSFSPESRVIVFPFSRQPEGEEVVIGLPERGSFLALPPDAVETLDWLAEGHTVEMVRKLYAAKHGEVPDLEDFLAILAQKGFVRPLGETPGKLQETAQVPRKPHFAGISQPFARRLFSPGVIKACSVWIAMGLTVAALEPGIVPGATALYFAEHRALCALGLFLLSYAGVFIHEMGHLIAARAVGVGTRMSISHRLWVLVAETDLTGLWTVPKRQRYLPLLAGPLLDAVSASTLALVLFFSVRSPWHLPVLTAHFLEALLFLYLMRLLWQCFFFVRTDFYYVFATAFGCRSLMQDTESFLSHQLARLGLGRAVKPSLVSPREGRVIRAYAPLWLAGRALAFGTLFFITIPLAARYLRSIGETLTAGFSTDPYAFIDSILMALFTLVPLGAGLALWLASLSKKWSKHHAKASAEAA